MQLLQYRININVVLDNQNQRYDNFIIICVSSVNCKAVFRNMEARVPTAIPVLLDMNITPINYNK